MTPAPTPVEKRIARVLLQQWQAQKETALQQIAKGERVDLSEHTEDMARAILPFLQEEYQRGGAATMQALARQVARLTTGGKCYRRPGLSAWSVDWLERTTWDGSWRRGKGITFGFDVFDERVLSAIWSNTLELCEATLATTAADVEDAIHEVRSTLAEALEAGETSQEISARIGDIFSDSERAFTIAQSETSRAVHAGQVLAAKESGVVRGKRWIASSDACEKICLPLHGKEVGLDEAFMVLPGKSAYSTVFHPPAHPRCMCTQESVLDENYLASLGVSWG